MKIFLVCSGKNNVNVIDIVSAKTPEEVYENTGITDNNMLSELTLIELTEPNIERIESIRGEKQKKKYKESRERIETTKIEDVYDNLLTATNLIENNDAVNILIGCQIKVLEMLNIRSKLEIEEVRERLRKLENE